jgi:hypothetical protein
MPATKSSVSLAAVNLAPKRGRPAGATSWWRNLENVGAHHANVLLELWLAGAQVLEIRVMLSSLASSPKHQAMIEDCWRVRGNERRHTVPPRIKRSLCQLAVAHVVELRLDAILRQGAQAAVRKLRLEGWTDTQIAEIPAYLRGARAWKSRRRYGRCSDLRPARHAQIPIAGAARRHVSLSAISFIGDFRTPANVHAADHLPPASENLHRRRHWWTTTMLGPTAERGRPQNVGVGVEGA